LPVGADVSMMRGEKQEAGRLQTIETLKSNAAEKWKQKGP